MAGDALRTGDLQPGQRQLLRACREQPPARNIQVSYVMKSLFRSLIFSGGAGWALDSRYRFGAALLFDLTETGDIGQTSGDIQDGTALQTVIHSLDFSGTTLHLMGTLSAQAEPFPWLSLGLVLRPRESPCSAKPRFASSPRHRRSRRTSWLCSTTATPSSTSARPSRPPWASRCDSGRFELEGDIRWYPASATYTLPRHLGAGPD